MVPIPVVPGQGRPPRQADLDAAFVRAVRAEVVRGGVDGERLLGGDVVAAVAASELPSLREALRIREGGPAFRCACHGDMGIQLVGPDGPVATMGYHHGVSLRFAGWGSDAALEDGERFLHWLAARGEHGPLGAFERDRDERDTRERARERWVVAAPAAVGPHLPSLERESIPSISRAEYTPVLAALETALPDIGRRVRGLLAWYGSGAGPWSTFPAYERVAERLLFHVGTSAVLGAMASQPLSPLEAIGAGRFLVQHGTTRAGLEEVVALPESVRHDILARVRAGGVEENVALLESVLQAAPPVAPPAGAVLVGRAHHRRLTCICTEGDRVFALDEDGIVRYDERYEATVVRRSPALRWTPLAVHGGELYFVEGRVVGHMPLDGSEATFEPPRGSVARWIDARPFGHFVAESRWRARRKAAAARGGTAGSRRLELEVPSDEDRAFIAFRRFGSKRPAALRSAFFWWCEVDTRTVVWLPRDRDAEPRRASLGGEPRIMAAGEGEVVVLLSDSDDTYSVVRVSERDGIVARRGFGPLSGGVDGLWAGDGFALVRSRDRFGDVLLRVDWG